MQIDHLVVTAATLQAGADMVEQVLGYRPGPGGRHEVMGTHNLLLSLGAGRYLEVIAPDPEAEAPGRPRWFGLDTPPAAPRLAYWVAECPDLRSSLGAAPLGMGEVLDLSRGSLTWSMAVPRDGQLPGGGVLPALLHWKGGRAGDLLPASDCRLQSLVLRHPEIDMLRDLWPALGAPDGIVLETAATPSLEANIVTPRGVCRLTGAPDA